METSTASSKKGETTGRTDVLVAGSFFMVNRRK